MMMLLRRNEEGFTLVEVMLVVIIIGIIAIIALPKLLVSKGTAEEKSCLANLQALRTANEQCKWDTGFYGAGADVPALIDSLTAAEYLPINSAVSGVCPGPEVVVGTPNYAYEEDPDHSQYGSITCAAHSPPP